MKRILMTVLLGAAGAILYRYFTSAGFRARLAPSTTPEIDRAGHYDIDGVSADDEGIVVASDATATEESPSLELH